MSRKKEKKKKSPGKKRGRRRIPLRRIALTALAAGVITGFVFLTRHPSKEKPVTVPARSPYAPSPDTLPPREAALFQSALALMNRGRFDAAVPVLRKCLERLPPGLAKEADRSLVHYNLCVALKKLNRPEEALAETLEYLKKNPEDPVHNTFAGTLLYERHRYREAAQRFEKGLSRGTEAARKVTSDPLAIVCQLADSYLFLGETEKARSQVEKVLAVKPNHPGARRIKGLLALRRRDFRAAVEIFEPLLRENPKDSSLVYDFARAALEAGEPKRALDGIRRHWATGATREKGLRLRYAKALLQSGRPKEATAEAAALLILDPEYDEAYFVLANALARSGFGKLARPFRERYSRGAKLRAELERARTAQQAGYPSSAAYYRGRAYARAGRYVKAMAELKKARKLAPRNGQIVAELAGILMDVERPLDAVEILEKFERTALEGGFPLLSEFFLAKARAAWLLGDSQGAEAALERAGEDERKKREVVRYAARVALLENKASIIDRALSPFKKGSALDLELTSWFAIKKLLQGKAAPAAEELEKVFSSMPQPRPEVLLALGRARLKTGRRKEAAEAFRELLKAEELLRAAWEGLKEADASEEERSRAERWLGSADDIEDRLKEEWELMKGETDPGVCARALLRAARLRNRLGMRKRARSLALLARSMDFRNSEIHREILVLFKRPEDAFDRLHSLEALKRLTPEDRNVKLLRRKEYARLGLSLPEGSGSDTEPAGRNPAPDK